MRLFGLIALIILTACTSVNVSTYAGKDLHYANQQVVGIFELEAWKDDKYSCKYQHRSDITRGKPFNEEWETFSHDLVLCGATFEIWTR